MEYSEHLKGNKTFTAYIPHGVSMAFEPIKRDSEDYPRVQQFKENLGIGDKSFVVLFNNRNIRRKQPGDLILAYKEFCDSIGAEAAKNCVLLLHTQGVDNNGTDLNKVIEMLCPDYDVVFTNKKYDTVGLNLLYNCADVTVNISSNEGFGLATAESLAAGTPIVVNVTGGLQDQCGFNIDGRLLTSEDYVKKPSLHDVDNLPDNLSWGRWAKPVWPTNRSLQGSPPTPYIYDDRCYYKDVAKALHQWYDMDADTRYECGLEGAEYVRQDDVAMMANKMGERFSSAIETVLNNWEPKDEVVIWKI